MKDWGKVIHTSCPECSTIFTPEPHWTDLTKLKTENARLREALKYYAYIQSKADQSIAHEALTGGE